MNATDPATTEVDHSIVAKIVSSYVRKNHVAPAEMPFLINTVYESLLSLLRPAEPERTAAVPIRRSVTRNYVVCLECGWRARTLRRHLRIRHELSPSEYRARWKLPLDHRLTAPALSERQSRMAKQLGLGQQGREAAATARRRRAETSPKPARPRRRTRAVAPT